MKKLSNFIKWNIHGSFRKFLIPWEISAKLFLWGRSWDNGTLTFLKVWVLLLDLNSVVYFITWMPWFPRHYSIAWENAAKLILWGELGNLVSIFFSIGVWVFPWYSMIHFITCEMNGCSNQFAANFPQHPSYRESLEYWHLHFSQSMDVCLRSYSNPVFCMWW